MVNVRQLRRDIGMSQTEMADLLHISKQLVSGWEMGRNEVKWRYRKKLRVICFKSGKLPEEYGLYKYVPEEE
jgi:DNA-binding transcriptional regulator YiaG